LSFKTLEINIELKNAIFWLQ